MGLLEWKNWKVMDQLFLDGQAAHLQLRCGDSLDAGQRDRLRADLVRKALTIQDAQRN
jgi:protein-arginine kinase